MRPGTGEPRRERSADLADVGVRTEILAQHDVAFGSWIGQSVGETRTRTTESEDRLVGVGGDDRRLGSGADESDEFCCLRVEVLCVVDDQVPDAIALTREELGICRERRQRRPDQLGGVDRGRRRTGSREPHGPAQQHVLLVLCVCPRRGDPFGSAMCAAERREFFRADATLGSPHHEVAQCLREAVGAQRGT